MPHFEVYTVLFISIVQGGFTSKEKSTAKARFSFTKEVLSIAKAKVRNKGRFGVLPFHFPTRFVRPVENSDPTVVLDVQKLVDSIQVVL
jgi:hypothetical protein